MVYRDGGSKIFLTPSSVFFRFKKFFTSPNWIIYNFSADLILSQGRFLTCLWFCFSLLNKMCCLKLVQSYPLLLICPPRAVRVENMFFSVRGFLSNTLWEASDSPRTRNQHKQYFILFSSLEDDGTAWEVKFKLQSRTLWGGWGEI